MKRTVLFLVFILLMPIVAAGRVFVVKFNYDDGLITYKDKVIKYGYAPDRRIQPLEGYRAEMVSIDDNVLYSFKFDIPLRLNVDLSDSEKALSGGMLILNETDFALVFPYYDRAKSIVIYNPRGYDVLIIPLIEEQFMQQKSSLWFLVLIVLLLIVGYMIYKHYRNKQS